MEAAFGENSPMMVNIPPPLQLENNSSSNTLFLPLPLHNNNDNNNNLQVLYNHHRRGSINTNGSSSLQDPSSSYNTNNNNSNNTHNDLIGGGGGGSSLSSSSSTVKAKIMAHPLYHRLLAAYVNCQKIGAPAEGVARLEEAAAYAAALGRSTEMAAGTGRIGEDPGLDQFMEAYCEMLTKYEQELSKPFKEAMFFLSKLESQFNSLTVAASPQAPVAANSSSSHSGYGEGADGSPEEEADVNNSLLNLQADDMELKGQLLRKYSGYLGSLKQEFMKKRKKGKLPKEARLQLLDWWSRNYKWPYPTESQKLALAHSTGLDPKQINNWFINQRKRHWKPSEDMQFVVMDATHPHFYMDHSNVLANHPFPMDISPGLL